MILRADELNLLNGLAGDYANLRSAHPCSDCLRFDAAFAAMILSRSGSAEVAAGVIRQCEETELRRIADQYREVRATRVPCERLRYDALFVRLILEHRAEIDLLVGLSLPFAEPILVISVVE